MRPTDTETGMDSTASTSSWPGLMAWRRRAKALALVAGLGVALGGCVVIIDEDDDKDYRDDEYHEEE